MEIKLITATPSFLKTIWIAARTCYSPLSPIELSDQEPLMDDMLRIIDHLIKQKHLSVLEHCSVTFAVKDVSRTLLAQYSRHRIGVSLSVQSQRYVSERRDAAGGLFDYVVPEAVTNHQGAQSEFLQAMEQAQKSYDALLTLGIRKEDARFVLPGGAGTNFVTTLNLRSFLDVYQKRVLTPGAQWEIRAMLKRMGELLQEREPWLGTYLG